MIIEKKIQLKTPKKRKAHRGWKSYKPRRPANREGYRRRGVASDRHKSGRGRRPDESAPEVTEQSFKATGGHGRPSFRNSRSQGHDGTVKENAGDDTGTNEEPRGTALEAHTPQPLLDRFAQLIISGNLKPIAPFFCKFARFYFFFRKSSSFLKCCR